MAKAVQLRIPDPTPRTLNVELEVAVQAATRTLRVAPGQRLVDALDVKRPKGSGRQEFDMCVDGRWFRRCVITAWDGAVTVEYMDAE